MLPVIITSCSNDDEDEVLMGKWHRVSDFDGLARSEATSFTIGNKGYLTGGYDARKHLNDLWEYDMEQDSWTQKATFPGPPRSAAVAFSVNISCTGIRNGTETELRSLASFKNWVNPLS